MCHARSNTRASEGIRPRLSEREGIRGQEESREEQEGVHSDYKSPEHDDLRPIYSDSQLNRPVRPDFQNTDQQLASLALKRLVSSNILPSSLRLVRPIVTAPSTSTVSSTNAMLDDVFDLLSPTRRPSQVVNTRDQLMKNPFFSASRGMSTLTKGRVKESNDRETDEQKNILRPLSPHLPIYKPQLNSTLSITKRISGAFLTTLLLFLIFFL
ncbi:uncharacterized protein LOC120128614 [Hibiscus syriacus]|uniref:uncharacterized protein LOC120128614 n=1 Tax=Hibiscus syriacus TaxID=106335 RepID=UPI001924685A|nr:uncharacterized protein LOC120128614 [Hibiscus syriacus]